MIEEEIYKKIPRTTNWKLGKLHEEWNDYLQDYDLINIKAPRFHLKTFFFFEANALNICRHNAGVEIQYFTGSDDLAIKKLGNIREYAQLPYFIKMLEGADVNNKSSITFNNGSSIYVQGYGSRVRGGHPDWIILDDVIDSQVLYSEEANKKSKERLASEILPMAGKHTKIIIIGTLQKDNDLYSIDWGSSLSRKSINKAYDAITDEEKHLTLFPEVWDWDSLMAKKDDVVKASGLQWFNKEYRNMPTNLLGEIIKPEWKQTYTELPSDIVKTTGWDLAVGKDIESGDYTAKVTIGYQKATGNIYIIDVYRARIDFGNRIRQMIDQGRREKPYKIQVEDNTFQADTVQQAKRNAPDLTIRGIKTTTNKVEKFVETLEPLFENKKVFLKEGDSMQETFWEELCSLPRGAHDDMADALCIALKDLPVVLKASDVLTII